MQGKVLVLRATGVASSCRRSARHTSNQERTIKSTQQSDILSALARVAAERRLRDADAQMAHQVSGIKQWQHDRFKDSYPDFLDSTRYGPAAHFFLDELYGPTDFSTRDRQFSKVVPALVRLFPAGVVETVHQLAELHALSEQLDTQMARQLGTSKLDVQSYGMAWRAVAQPDLRARQIELMIGVGRSLDRYTRKPLMRQSLRMMRGPAQSAGLGELQRFLEQGFDAFRRMTGAEEFLQTIAERERKLASELFALPS